MSKASNNKANTKNNNKINTNNNKTTPKPPKRKPSDLLKLYEKEIITQSQYSAGERLQNDYETSFKNRCTTANLNRIRVQHSNKIDTESYIIQNLDSWDRYIKALSSIEDIKTREIVRSFIIEGKGLTDIDRQLKRNGVAEVRLCYGLNDLVKYYTKNKKQNLTHK